MTEAEYKQRRKAAGARLTDARVDALLVTSLANVRYLTGFTGSNAAVILFPGRVVLLTDSRYKLQAAEETGCPVRIVQGKLKEGLGKYLTNRVIARLGFDPIQTTCQGYVELKSAAQKLVPVTGMLEELRMVKSPAEIELIRASVEIASKAYGQVLRLVRPGVTEMDLAAELDHRMRKLGAERPAFDTIVATGGRTALPHASPTSKKLCRNELLLIDMGAVRNGYASDMTRTVFVGRAGSEIRRHHRAVLEAQLAAIAVVKEGATAEAVDRAARRVLKGYGLERAFVHACGHGLGLEIHEPPRLGQGQKTRLRAGMAITIEPGVYLQKLGGIRIEDTVVVTRNGCEILTPTAKEFLAV